MSLEESGGAGEGNKCTIKFLCNDIQELDNYSSTVTLFDKEEHSGNLSFGSRLGRLNVDDEDGRIPCKVPGCDKKLKTENYMKVHMRCHTNERPYKCHVKGCEQSFRWRTSLAGHKRAHERAAKAAQQRALR